MKFVYGIFEYNYQFYSGRWLRWTQKGVLTAVFTWFVCHAGWWEEQKADREWHIPSQSGVLLSGNGNGYVGQVNYQDTLLKFSELELKWPFPWFWLNLLGRYTASLKIFNCVQHCSFKLIWRWHEAFSNALSGALKCWTDNVATHVNTVDIEIKLHWNIDSDICEIVVKAEILSWYLAVKLAKLSCTEHRAMSKDAIPHPFHVTLYVQLGEYIKTARDGIPLDLCLGVCDCSP